MVVISEFYFYYLCLDSVFITTLKTYFKKILITTLIQVNYLSVWIACNSLLVKIQESYYSFSHSSSLKFIIFTQEPIIDLNTATLKWERFKNYMYLKVTPNIFLLFYFLSLHECIYETYNMFFISLPKVFLLRYSIQNFNNLNSMISSNS